MEVRVGLLVAVCVALLVAFVIVLGGVSTGGGRTIHLDVETSASLKAGAPVKIAGVDAGKVTAVDYRGGEVDPAVGRPVFVRVTLSIDDARLATLTEHARFYITTQGVLGEKYVEIEPSPRPGTALREGVVLVGEPPLRLEVMAMNANRVLRTLSDVLSRNEEAIDSMIRNASDTMGTLKGTAERIDKLLATTGPDVEKAIRNLDAIEAEALAVLKGARDVIGDGSELKAVVREAAALAKDARGAIAPVVKDVRATLERYQKVGEVAETTLGELKRELDGLVGKATSIFDDALVLTGRLKSGEGTVGALLSDREMYDDIREMMKDLKRHPWKFIWKE
jgi:phospholipid/cholesterol/gamma-HCH transport system substrate-binding protein